MRKTCFLATVTILGCGPVQTEYERRVDLFCNDWVVNWVSEGGDAFIPEVELCELWREEELSDREIVEFCWQDLDTRNGMLDVDALCTVDIDPEETDDFAATIENWRADSEAGDCASFAAMFVGTCGDGKRFAVQATGFTGVCNFYDAQSEEFLGTIHWSDFITPPCCARWYWPEWIDCPDSVITEVICGEELVEEGEALQFPLYAMTGAP